MSDPITVTRNYILPNLVEDQDKIKEHIDGLYAQIEQIRHIENRYLDSLVEELNTLTGQETADFVNTGSNNPNAPSEDVRFEKWQRTLINETIQLECHLGSLKTKQQHLRTRMMSNLDRLDQMVALSLPQQPRDRHFYAMIKQFLFG